LLIDEKQPHSYHPTFASIMTLGVLRTKVDEHMHIVALQMRAPVEIKKHIHLMISHEKYIDFSDDGDGYISTISTSTLGIEIVLNWFDEKGWKLEHMTSDGPNSFAFVFRSEATEASA
jgi:hypothetical protein